LGAVDLFPVQPVRHLRLRKRSTRSFCLPPERTTRPPPGDPDCWAHLQPGEQYLQRPSVSYEGEVCGELPGQKRLQGFRGKG